MAALIYVILADGFEEIEAVVPVDILRRAGLDVYTVGLTEKQVRGSHNITITADKTWNEIGGNIPDVLVLPGGMPGAENLGKHSGLKELAEKTVEKGNRIAAICAAPALTLAAWKMLDGRQAVCYPGFEAGYNRVHWQTEPVVLDGQFITAKGPGVALPFAVGIIGILQGRDKADSIIKAIAV